MNLRKNIKARCLGLEMIDSKTETDEYQNQYCSFTGEGDFLGCIYV
jgi:hypothetical protein